MAKTMRAAETEYLKKIDNNRTCLSCGTHLNKEYDREGHGPHNTSWLGLCITRLEGLAIVRGCSSKFGDWLYAHHVNIAVESMYAVNTAGARIYTHAFMWAWLRQPQA